MVTDALVMFFSGSGNSEAVARALASRLPGSTLRPLFGETSGAELRERSGRVVLVFPVHFMQAPRAVLARLGELDLAGVSMSAIATSGGESGDALGQVSDALDKRGARLSASVHIPIADNSVAFVSPTAVRERNIEAAGRSLDALAERLKGAWAGGTSDAMRQEPMTRRKPLRWRAAGGLTKAGMLLAYRYDRKRVDTRACTGCGMCSKACPVGNIALIAGTASIGARCADCFGCLHACPVSAISFGRIRVTPESRYRPPVAI